jgi:hypothetical protein
VIEEQILEAAHIVDYGFADSEWYNGLPLCRNHHRAFDIGLIKLNPATNVWEPNFAAGVTLAALGVTKPNLDHLPTAPHTDALTWKY